MAGGDRFGKRAYGSGLSYLIFIVSCVIFMAVMLTGIRWLGRLGNGQQDIAQHKREDTDFHTLPAAPRALVNPKERIAISDKSEWAQNESLTLAQYTKYYYSADMLTVEADYDKEGRLVEQSQWEYDAAGNLIREQTENEADGAWTSRYIYEYDNAGDVVHQKVYWNEKLVEDNYFRHTDIGRAGISFSYLDDRLVGGISDYCSGRMEFLEDEEGKLRCMFHFSTPETEHSKDASIIQWAQQGDYLISREQFYRYEAGYSTRSDWYQDIGEADWEQFNLYACDAETKKRNHVLQVNYEWVNGQDKFELSPSFYRARYDGDTLLWQMEYTDGILSYYTACRYDADGRLQTGVEYWLEEEPCAVFYRFEYPRFDQTERYSYDILGQEFTQTFGEGESVLLTFSEEGILTGIEMTDTEGNMTEKYEFAESGESAGRLEKGYLGSDVLTGEKAVLSRLEAEMEAYGSRAGEDLESGSADT